jgi:hypothetical protein
MSRLRHVFTDQVLRDGVGDAKSRPSFTPLHGV